MNFCAVRLSLIVVTTLGLAWGSVNAADYNYPYRDPYLATITTAVMNAEGHIPGAKRQAIHVPVLPDRNQLPTLEGRGDLSVALYRQSREGEVPARTSEPPPISRVFSTRRAFMSSYCPPR